MTRSVTLLFAICLSFICTSEGLARPIIDVHGQVRARPEMRNNADFNEGNDDEQRYIGGRTRLSVKASFQDKANAKITLQDTRRWGASSHVSTGQESQAIDLYEGYFELDKILGDNLKLKVGRQPFVYGDQRLLGHLGWTDFARTHDAIKASLFFGPVQADLFYAKEVESGKPSADNYDDDLMGVYAMIKPAKGITIDIYGINWKTAGVSGEGDSAIPTPGKNIWTYGGRAALKFGPVDFTGEAVMQSGDWAQGVTHEALAYAAKAGVTIGAIKTRIGAEYDYGSGDDNLSDTTHKTFVFPFHTNHMHYGAIDYFSWGNMTDISVNIKTMAVPGFVITGAYHMFTLAEPADNWYNVVGTGVFKAPAGSSDDAGQEIDVTVAYKVMDNFKLVGGYAMFTPGQAAKERSGGSSDTSTWGFLMTIFNF